MLTWLWLYLSPVLAAVDDPLELARNASRPLRLDEVRNEIRRGIEGLLSVIPEGDSVGVDRGPSISSAARGLCGESIISDDQTRKSYVDALQQADRGDLSPLVHFARS